MLSINPLLCGCSLALNKHGWLLHNP
uniref:Uncharacterized protein n=1 Tax=Anguilla anguilla TaxID=7936 RepID=A0A0E9RQL9_ANGAN